MGRLRVAVLVVVLLLIAGIVDAAPIDVRIDLSTGISSTSGNWNNISNLTGLTPALIDFGTGAATPISISGAGSPWINFGGDTGGLFSNLDWLIQPATVDGAGLVFGATGSFLFTGLTGSSYRVEVVTARRAFGYLNTITVAGALAGRTFQGTPVNTPWNSTTDGLGPSNWLIWDDVSPVGGSFTLTDVADQNTVGMLNAVRVLEVSRVIPEPTTLALFGIGLAGLVAWRRRRRKA